MPFTVSAAAGHFSGAAGPNALTISANIGQLIAVVCHANGASGAVPGTLADTGLNAYTAGTALTSQSASWQSDTFFILSATAGVTAITYTPGFANLNSNMAAWVLTPSATPIRVSPESVIDTTSTTAANAVTTASLNVTSDGIILGYCWSKNGNGLTIGTVPAMVFDANVVSAAFGIMEHFNTSSPAACTWTSTVIDNVFPSGFAFLIAAAGGGATSTPPSTSISASTVAASNALPFFGAQWNQFVQMQISNQTPSWAYVNFGVVGAIIPATVATGFPVAPNSSVLVSVAPEVNGASVILLSGSGNVVFTRITHEPAVNTNH